MITITTDQGRRVHFTLADGYIVLQVDDGDRIYIDSADARQLRRFLENLG